MSTHFAVSCSRIREQAPFREHESEELTRGVKSVIIWNEASSVARAPLTRYPTLDPAPPTNLTRFPCITVDHPPRVVRLANVYHQSSGHLPRLVGAKRELFGSWVPYDGQRRYVSFLVREPNPERGA